MLLLVVDGDVVGHIEFYVPINYWDAFELSYELFRLMCASYSRSRSASRTGRSEMRSPTSMAPARGGLPGEFSGDVGVLVTVPPPGGV